MFERDISHFDRLLPEDNAMKLKESMFAGSWYPLDAEKCKRDINAFVSEFKGVESIGRPAFAAVVPHAGWFYSGKIACNAIRLLSEGEKPDLVVVFGMHMHTMSKPCLTDRGEWETPFGALKVDEDFASDFESESGLKFEKGWGNFIRDNTIELQMPFIRYFFGDVKVVAIGVPPSEAALTAGRQVVRSAEKLGRKIKIVSSTDLTHYGANYAFSPKGRGAAAVDWVKNVNDAGFIKKACSLDPEAIIKEALSNHSACCPGSVAAFAAAVTEAGINAPAVLMDYYTSNDIMQSDSFVGYAGILI